VNLPIWLSLGEIILTHFWEHFRSIMGTKGRARFLESNLSFCPILLLSDFGGKGMGA